MILNIFSHFLNDEKRRKKYAGHIRQYIALTGLDNEDFSDALGGLGRIHRFFQDGLPAGKLELLQPLSINGEVAMTCHTRYLTPRRYCQSADPQPFGLGVDPNNVLEHIAGQSHIHTLDNVVQFLGREKSDEKTKCDIFQARTMCIPDI